MLIRIFGSILCSGINGTVSEGGSSSWGIQAGQSTIIVTAIVITMDMNTMDTDLSRKAATIIATITNAIIVTNTSKIIAASMDTAIVLAKTTTETTVAAATKVLATADTAIHTVTMAIIMRMIWCVTAIRKG